MLNLIKTVKIILELDITTLLVDDGMEKLYEKLDTFFLEDANHLTFKTYELFKQY